METLLAASIRQKIVLFIVLISLLAYGGLVAYNLIRLQGDAGLEAQREVKAVASGQARQMDLALQGVGNIATSTANFVETSPLGDPHQIFRQLSRNVAQNSAVYGSALAFEPHVYPRKRLFCPYVCRSGPGTRQLDLAKPSYNYTLPRWEWYDAPRRLGRSIWTNPYFDAGGGNIRMSTFSVPFRRGGRFAGVATVDIPLDVLNQKLAWPNRRDLHIFIIAADGTYVYHPDKSRILRDSLPAESRRSNSELLVLSRAMQAGRRGIKEVNWDGRREWVAFSPIHASGWSLGVRLPQDVVMDQARAEVRRTVVSLSISLVLVVTVIWLAIGNMLLPLGQLSEAAKIIASGEMPPALDVGRNDEVGQLSRAFADMAERLRERENALRDSRGERLAHILEGIGGKHFFYSLNPDGSFIHVSASVERVLGYTSAEYQSNHRSYYTANPINLGLRRFTEQALEGTSPPIYEIEMSSKDGAVRRLEVCERPLFDDAGQVLSVEGLASDVTERVQATEWFRSLIEAAPDGIVITDQGGRIVLVNAQIEKMYGYTRDELIGMPGEMLCVSASGDVEAAGTWNHLESNRHQGEGTIDEFHGRRKNGEEFPIELSQRPVRMDNEPGEMVSTSVRDVTARRQAERAMRESQHRVDMASQAGKLSFVEYSTITREGWVKGHVARLVGKPDTINATQADLEKHILEEDRARVTAERDAHMAGDATEYQMEYRIRAADGEIHWLDIQGQIIRDADGKPERIYAVLIDNTKRREAEDAVRESEKRFKSILDNMQGGFMRADMGGIVQFINPGMARILGYNGPDDVVGKNIAQDIFMYPEDRERLLGLLLRDGQVENFELVFKRRDGMPVWVEDNVHVIYDASGLPIGVEGLLRDVTEQREAREALLAARRAADEANRAKSDFLANMSHEIRTPMNAIIGMSHLALQTALDPRQRNYLQKIDVSSRNLLGILNDILDFSKIEAGKLHLESIDFRLEDVLHNVSDMLGARAQEKGIELLFRWDPGVPNLLVGDPLRLGQILINLTSNAVKFTSQGEVEVWVEEVGEDEESATLRFSVRDTGIGLDPEQLAKLFQAFSQADTSTTRKYGGTGLGLTISRNLVEMMHGTIEVQSEPGVGSTFVFTLTLPRQHARSVAATAFPSALSGIRALVVDDNATAREILVGMLTSFHFEADATASAQTGLDLLNSAEPPYDLVLLDWQMPGMDGLEAARRIAADESLAKRPQVIMVSAHAREELIWQAESAGVDSVLIKPISPSLLLDSIMQAFGVEVAATGHHSMVPERDILPLSHDLAGARVLLVEDNEINQEVALELLGSGGLQVDMAQNGAEAIEKLRMAAANGQLYDAVLMDCQMPVMDGFEATRLLREDHIFAALPIIAMTANAMAHDREKCLLAGMNDHIAKPIDVENLFAVLRHWIKFQGGGLVTDATNVPPEPENRFAAESVPLPSLPGVNVVDGVARLGGNAALFLRLVSKFRTDQADVVGRIREDIASGSTEGARLLAHTLKGLAANLGMETLATAAAALDSALRAEAADKYPDLTDAVAGQLDPLLEAIDAQIVSGPTGPGPRPMDPETTAGPPPLDQAADLAVLSPALAELGDLLESSDTSAVNSLETLRPILGNFVHTRQWRELETALANFEFETALDRLAAFKSDLGIE